MKKSFLFIILLLSFIFWQGCGSKTREDRNELAAQADSVKSQRTVILAKRAWLAKESAKKAEQRSQAVAEKAKISSTYKDASGKIIYIKAEVDPSYTGGEKELRKFLKENLKYPQEARDRGVEGTVFVDFVIDDKGKVREVVAADVVGEDVDWSLKEESVRVVSSMPGWKAGIQHGKAVEVSFSIPITFELLN